MSHDMATQPVRRGPPASRRAVNWCSITQPPFCAVAPRLFFIAVARRIVKLCDECPHTLHLGLFAFWQNPILPEFCTPNMF